jgi:hypothetical protein
MCLAEFKPDRPVKSYGNRKSSQIRVPTNHVSRVGISKQGTTAEHVPSLHVNGGKVLFNIQKKRSYAHGFLRQAS